MLERRTLKPYSGKGYSTANESLLSEIITLLNKALGDLDSHYAGKNSPEDIHSSKQLKAVKNLFIELDELCKFFTKGSKPGYFEEFSVGAKMIAILNLLSSFYTPAYALFNILGKSTELWPSANYVDQIIAAYKKINKQPISNENINEFKTELKKQIKISVDAYKDVASKIPGYDKKVFLEKVDSAIDGIAFETLFNNKEIKDQAGALEGALKAALFNLTNKPVKGKYNKHQLQILDQYTYDFAMQILTLIELAPAEFQKLASFLSPDSIDGLGINGLGQVNRIKEDPEANNVDGDSKVNKRNYFYRITGGLTGDMNLDLEDAYSEFISNFTNQLTEEIIRFRKENPDSLVVQSELAKTQLIEKYIEQEHKTIEICLRQIKVHEGLLALDIDEEMDIQTLSTTLLLLQKSILNYTLLKQKIRDYDHLSFAELIKEDSDLVIILKANNTKGLDTSYQLQVLPEILIFKDKHLNVRNYIFANDMNSINDFLAIENNYLQKIKEIEDLLKPKMEALAEQEIKKHKEHNASNEEPFKLIALQAQTSVDSEEYHFPADLEERMQYIEQEKQELAQQCKALDVNYQKVRERQDKIRAQSGVCPVELSTWDPNILKAISACYESSWAQAEQCLVQLNQITAILEAKNNQLEQELKKVKATIALNETKKSSDSASIKKLKEENQKAHQELLEEQALLLEAKAANTATNVPDKTKEQAIDKRLQACKDTKNEINVKLGSLIEALIYLSKDAETVFQDEIFQSVKGIQVARFWLEKQLQSYSQALLNPPQINEHVNLSSTLRRVVALIEKEQPFPFQKLDELLDGKLGTIWKRGNGFDLFLNHTHLVLKDRKPVFQPDELERWKGYRGKKDNANNPAFEKDKLALLAKIDTKQAEIENDINRRAKLSTYKKHKRDMESLRGLMLLLEDQMTDVINVTEIYQQDLKEKQQAFLAKEIVLNEKIAKNEKEQKTLNVSIDLFDQIEFITTNYHQLSLVVTEIENLITENSTVEKLNRVQEQITSLLEETSRNIVSLEKSLITLEEAITPLEEKGIYTDYLTKHNQLILDTKTRIETSKNAIFKVLEAGSQPKIKELLACLNRLDSKVTEAVVPSEEEGITWVTNQILRYKSLAHSVDNVLEMKVRLFKELSFDTTGQLLEKVRAQIGTLDVEAQAVKDALPALSEKIIKELANSLKSELDQNSRLIPVNVYAALTYLSKFPLNDLNTLKGHLTVPSTDLEEVTTEFQLQIAQVTKSYADEIQAIQDKITAINIDKKKATYDSNLAKLQVIRLDLDKFPKQMPAQFKGLKDQINALYTNYRQKLTDNDVQGRVIQARKVLIDSYKRELDTYFSARVSSYSVKDRFFSEDRDEREKYITALKSELDSYLDSADSASLNNILKSTFTGYGLKPILNRLKMDIKAQNQPVEKPNADEARRVLSTIGNQELRGMFTNLYNEIKSMDSLDKSDANYAKVANNLMNSLTREVDQFLTKNQDLFASGASSDARLKALTEFQEDFTCCLNSQNDVLSQHVTWGPILANIGLALLAVCTGGITLGIQAIVMKDILGRDSIWVRPEGITKVANMEERAEDIGRFNFI